MRIRGLLIDCGDTVLVEKMYGNRMAVVDEPEAVPGAAEVLPLLAARYRLAIVANTSVATERDIRGALAAVGLEQYFQVVLTSVDEGIRKPDVRIFHRALARLEVPVAAAAMIGNQLDTDIAGALAVGMPAILLRWNDAYPARYADVTPTALVRTWAEIPAVLERLEGTDRSTREGKP